MGPQKLTSVHAFSIRLTVPSPLNAVRKPGEFAYTKEQRLEEHREEVAQREKEAEKARKAKKSTPWDKEHVKRREGFDPLPDDESKVYQKNAGEWDFTLR